ncbi:MAG: hypothetical protein AAF647_02155 [Pseudomonadota bacterium]
MARRSALQQFLMDAGEAALSAKTGSFTLAARHKLARSALRHVPDRAHMLKRVGAFLDAWSVRPDLSLAVQFHDDVIAWAAQASRLADICRRDKSPEPTGTALAPARKDEREAVTRYEWQDRADLQ